MLRVLILLLISFSTLAKVPKFKNTKEMLVPALPQLPQFDLEFEIDLPLGQKINQAARSYIFVHEKIHGKGWTRVLNIDIKKNVLISGMDLTIQRKLNLSHANSKLLVSSTIVHCSNDDRGGCYIDTFQKTINRKLPAKTGVLQKITFKPTRD